MPNQHSADHAALTEPLTLLQAADVAQWVETYTPLLRATLIRAAHLCAEDVEDVLQDVWVQAIRYTAKIASLNPAHRRNYLMNIVRTVLVQRHRRTTTGYTHTPNPDRFNVTYPVPLGTFTDTSVLDVQPVTASRDWVALTEVEQTTAVRMTLQAVWDALSEKDRHLLGLLLSGLSAAEIADTLAISLRAAQVRIWRMRQVLREVGKKIA